MKYTVKVTTEVDYSTLKEFATIGDTIYWLDKLLFAVCGFSLMSELNDLQLDTTGPNGEPLFPNKFEMPIRIYNYIIQQYNLKITED